MYSVDNDFRNGKFGTSKTKYGQYYRLRLSTALGRKTIGLGANKIHALQIAIEIDQAISKAISNNEPIEIDSLRDLAKARVESFSEPKRLQIVEKNDIQVIWDNYVSFHTKLGKWEEGYIYTHIQTVTNILAKCPIRKLENKKELVEWLFSDKSRSPKTSKQRFKLIVAAIDWASIQGDIPRKYGIEYRDLLNSIKLKKDKNNSEETDIKIFSVSEIDMILDALENDTYSRFPGKHSQYYPFVKFLWLTGCRPSEAIALKWENVSNNKIKICERESSINGKVNTRKGTKTEGYRYFPVNGDLQGLLDSLPKREGHVFIRNTGKPIHMRTFQGVWKRLLNAMGIEYRQPYQLRHSMISYHANNDVQLHELAEVVGNSTEVIQKHYLKIDIDRISLPTIQR